MSCQHLVTLEEEQVLELTFSQVMFLIQLLLLQLPDGGLSRCQQQQHVNNNNQMAASLAVNNNNNNMSTTTTRQEKMKEDGTSQMDRGEEEQEFGTSQ